VVFSDPDNLRSFSIVVSPDQGFWKNGRFFFDITIPEEYNMKPPHVVCRTKVWHPNIAISDGGVCLSLLRTGTIDGMGWTPARTLKEVVWGIDSLFSDLLNPDDPLNVEAAEQYRRDQEGFKRKVKHYIQQERYR
jgi:ubiquitin-conjugating enzyme E2 F